MTRGTIFKHGGLVAGPDRKLDLRKKGLATLLAASALLTGGMAAHAGANEGPPAEATQAANSAPAQEQQFLELLNQVRSANGKASLLFDATLSAQAREWSSEMDRSNTLKHSPSYGNDTQAAMTADESWSRAGENVGVGFAVQSLHDAFVASAPHLANIVGDFNEVGIGVVNDGNSIWVTFRFAKIANTRSGDGADSVAIRRNGVWHMRHTNTSGPADRAFAFGDPRGDALVGDWDGDGVDTIGVRVGNRFELRNSNDGGPADVTIHYGRTNDQILVGDWDGDGRDTIAVRRGRTYYFRNDLASGNATTTMTYGLPTDQVYAGDWNNDGKDTLVVRRGATYYFRDDLRSGVASKVMGYGWASDKVVIGDWDGRGGDSIGIHRGRSFYLRNALSSGVAENTFSFGDEADEFFAGDF